MEFESVIESVVICREDIGRQCRRCLPLLRIDVDGNGSGAMVGNGDDDLRHSLLWRCGV